MAITTYEGVVEKGKVRLKGGAHLPENAKVYVIVIDLPIEKNTRVVTTRLVKSRESTDSKQSSSQP